jgi:hypothetical protein
MLHLQTSYEQVDNTDAALMYEHLTNKLLTPMLHLRTSYEQVIDSDATTSYIVTIKMSTSLIIL